MDEVLELTPLYDLLLWDDCIEIPEQLLYRKKGDAHFSDGVLYIKENSVVMFDTYFNSFSADKWKHYTLVDKFFLELCFSGKILLRIYEMNSRKTVFEGILTSKGKSKLHIPFFATSVAAFDIEAISDSSLFGGAYCCDNTVEWSYLDIAMCTYKREKYVKRNIKTLDRALKKYKYLASKCHLFLVDNGGTLDDSILGSGHVSVFHQTDLGGTAGNMRALLEIMARRKNDPSFVVFMDDDVEFLPNMLQRLHSFTSLLREEHLCNEIAGAMFALEKRNVQHESGAIFTGIGNVSIHEDWDMCKAELVVENEDFSQAQYGAGFLRVIPLNLLKEKGTFFPAFMRYDDVEYGLRIGTSPITLNGIQVWHESFQYKDNSAVFYYEYRNALIVESMHRRKSFFEKVLRINRVVLWYSLCFHYNYSLAIVKGISDYLKGPEWLNNVDCKNLHEELLPLNYVYSPIDEDDNKEYILSNRYKRTDFKRRRCAHIKNELNMTGYTVRFSACNLVNVLAHLIVVDLKFCLRYGMASRKYRQSYPEICNQDYWRKILYGFEVREK